MSNDIDNGMKSAGMQQKKYKSREEWKSLINNLSFEEFQNLCYDIIQSNGFVNPQSRGKGPDGGRDITAEFAYKVGREEKRDSCWFQSKKQKEGVNSRQILTEVTKAQNEGIKRFIIASNSDTTPDCKDDIRKWNEKNRCEITDWTGNKFLDLLFENPHICQIYFPDEEILPLVDSKNPQTIIEQTSDLGKRFKIILELKPDKKINLNNSEEVADLLKKNIIRLNEIDINLKALIYQKISMFFHSLGRNDDALMFLEKSLEITPNNAEALLNKGFILEKIDEIEESMKCYDRILEIDPKNKFALNNKASNLRREGKLDEALKCIEKTLETDGNFIVAVQNKIEILKTMNRSEEALEYLKGKEKLFEKSIILKGLEVDLCIELLDLKIAFKLNEEILLEEPENINAINNKGVIYEKNSRYQYPEKYLKLAYECFEKTIASDDKYALGWSNKTVILMNSGHLSEAEEIIDLAYALFPRHPYVLSKKGATLLAKGKPREALNYFEKALKRYYREEFLIDRALALLGVHHWQEAIKDAQKILRYNPKSSDSYKILAEAHRHLREAMRSRQFAKKAKLFEKKPISLLEDGG